VRGSAEGLSSCGSGLGSGSQRSTWQAVATNQCSGPKADAIRVRRPLSNGGCRASKRSLRAAAARPKALRQLRLEESVENL